MADTVVVLGTNLFYTMLYVIRVAFFDFASQFCYAWAAAEKFRLNSGIVARIAFALYSLRIYRCCVF